METTIVNWDNIGIMEKKMEAPNLLSHTILIKAHGMESHGTADSTMAAWADAWVRPQGETRGDSRNFLELGAH